jgi:hypothetical protein
MVDSMTGVVIAEVPLRNVGAGVVSLGASQWHTEFRNGELVAKSTDRKRQGAGKIAYGGRQAPVTQAFGQHVAVGCGLGANDILQLAGPEGKVLFHFGGSAIEQSLLTLPAFKNSKSLVRGICVLMHSGDDLNIRAALQQRPESIAPLRIDEGSWRHLLPPSLPEEEQEESAALETFGKWWGERRWVAIPDASQEELLRAIVAPEI